MVLGRGTRAVQRLEPGMTKATLPLEQFRSGGFARVVVVDAERRRAWTNPVWWPEAGERRAVSSLRVIAARG
jgi:hypothetical protein